ncbi:hypothetical protein [Geminisphaera colitermitum]|uniref:hypothetical protein n=1 Tax=Geminisphaera colitermitum TaxID=1148786 RepID=UPI000158D215|nr:hypothetical protein [Geminisphaera colitermitum]
MSFEDELAAGFAELAAEAGTKAALSFRDTPIVGVLDEGTDDPLKADTKIGTVKRSRLVIARSELAKLQAKPKTGDVFSYGTGGAKLSIKDVEDFDPSDVTVTFIVKLVEAAP